MLLLNAFFKHIPARINDTCLAVCVPIYQICLPAFLPFFLFSTNAATNRHYSYCKATTHLQSCMQFATTLYQFESANFITDIRFGMEMVEIAEWWWWFGKNKALSTTGWTKKLKHYYFVILPLLHGLYYIAYRFPLWLFLTNWNNREENDKGMQVTFIILFYPF